MYFDSITLTFHEEDGENRLLVTQEKYDEIQLALQVEDAVLSADELGFPVVTYNETQHVGMRYYYCAEENAFYDSKIHDDCIEITPERMTVLLDEMDYGGVLYPDENGQPATRPPESPVSPDVPNEPEPFTLEQEYSFAKSRIAFGRFIHEVSPLTLPNGAIIKMDRESQSQLMNAYAMLKYDVITETPWKGVNGWGTLNLAAIEPVVTLVAHHVKASFAREEVLDNRLDVLYANEDIEAIKAFDWSIAD